MTRRPRPVRERELLEHALEFFSRNGFRETSLQDIADQLGITRPLFYYYFASKQDLLWKLIGHLGEELLSNARPIAAAEGQPSSRLRRLLEAHVAALMDNEAAFRIYFAERHLLRGERELEVRAGESAYLDVIASVIAEGQRDGAFREGDPRLVARLATGGANSIVRWFTLSGATSVPQIAELVADLFIAGVMTIDEGEPLPS